LDLLFLTQLYLYDQQEKIGHNEAVATDKKFIVGACERICNDTSTRGIYYPIQGPFSYFFKIKWLYVLYSVNSELLAIVKKYYLSNYTVRIYFS
jgi:hypothetical protein